MQYVYLAKGKYPRFHHPKTGDVGLPRDMQSPEFHARYAELLARVRAQSPIIDKQSFNWLAKQYQASVEFCALAHRTQEDYAQTLDLMAGMIGEQPFRFITRKVIKAMRDKYAATPRKAHKIKQMASGLYTWADQNDLVQEGFNPAKGIKEIKRQKQMHLPWDDGQIETAMANPPAHIETALYLALYTGQRAKDLAEMDWTRYDGARIRVRQSKTGSMIDIPAHPRLKAHLDSIRKDIGRMCISAGNRPYNSASLGAALRVYMHRLGIKDRTLHGLRFTVAVNLNDAGCSPALASSVLGHQTYEMAMVYMSRKLNADEAIKRLA